MSDHQHQWRRSAHLDSCHAYESRYSCGCGAVAVTRTERDPASDPYSAVWMEPTSEEPCQRCEELQGGERPTHTVRVVLADGTVERDTTETIPLDDEGEVAA